MIYEHSELTVPKGDPTIWRFMDFTKFVSLLHSKSLPFAQLKSMEDPYEGAFTASKYSDMKLLMDFIQEAESDPVKRKKIKETISTLPEFVRLINYVSCWHMNEHESAAMWKLYLKSDEGVAIKTKYSSALNSLDQTKFQIIPCVVKYIDFRTDSYPSGHAIHQAVHKRKSFEHESELRFIWRLMASENQNILTEMKEPKIHHTRPIRPISVDLPTLIQEVYVSPTSKEWFREVVENICRKYDLPCKVIRSSLYDSPLY